MFEQGQTLRNSLALGYNEPCTRDTSGNYFPLGHWCYEDPRVPGQWTHPRQ
jgi:hypothetical protein